MPLETNLSAAPFFDTFNPLNHYYGIGFKPSVAVQTRELNELQAILRHQLEQFGNVVFQKGTIIDGCNFTFYPAYPFVKIRDLTTDGFNVIPGNYVGMFVKNSANLQAIVVDSAQGFETTAPDLNTLYLTYRNSGNDSNTFAYSLGDVLTVFDSNTSIFKVGIDNGGSGFSNADLAVFTSAIVVNVSSGSFSNGDYVTQPSTASNLQIIGVDLVTLANTGQVILKLKPRTTDLANIAANSQAWALSNNESIHNASNTVVGTVEGIIGSGATAGITTDGSGRVIQINMITAGADYFTVPTVTIRSANNTGGLGSLALTAQNYLTKLTVANTVGAVGNAYAFGVSEGTIYQKGLFLRVEAQTIVVEKYGQVPNAVSVGFHSREEIINSNIDENLVDNASGFPNAQAPGADRIRIIPQLILDEPDSTDTNFLPVVSWSEGNPYRQNQTTAYSKLGDEMAIRTFETDGDFILSRFQVTTRSTYTSANEGSKFSVVVDPGAAYIKGYRIQNQTNFVIDVPKATDTANLTGQVINLNYGNWIRVKELGGVFQFSTGDTVNLYDTAKAFISNTSLVAAGNTTPQGILIGTARIRSLVQESGTPGDATAAYKLYLFDIVMNSGKNFKDVRSISYAGTFPGICDVVTQLDATTNTQVAKLANTEYDTLLFSTGVESLKNATNVNYTYRTIDQTLSVSNSGIITKSIASNPSESYVALGTLTADDLQDIYVVPVANNLIASANATGTINVATTSANILGNATTFTTDFAAGDYVYCFQNSTVFGVRRIQAVVNNTLMIADANSSFTATTIAAYRYFPKLAPVPFGTRSGLTGNVSANGNLLTLNFGMALQGTGTSNCAVAVNIRRTNASAGSKTAARDLFVRLCLANNTGNTTGPWCLGTADVFRLKGVFKDTANTVSNTSTAYTGAFYIDHKQNEDYVDIAYLYLRPQSGITLANTDWLLVQYDAFNTSVGGYYDAVSYLGSNATTIQTNDSKQLANLGSAVASWEVPEVYTSKGANYDLLNQFDFRPIVANSAAATTNSATSPINPAYSLSFGNTADPTNDKKFPLPDSAMSFDLEAYMARIDTAYCGKDGRIFVTRGTPKLDPSKIIAAASPKDSMMLCNIMIPPYPNLPQNLSNTQAEVIGTYIGNERLLANRLNKHVIITPSAPGTPGDSQPRGYTKKKIGSLERRIENLEYVTALSAMQTDMVNRVVPSSVDPSQNRFKFGFFVDDFSENISQDQSNPAYAAQVQNGRLTPPTVAWTIGYGDQEIVSIDYLDFPIVSQPNATTANTIIVANTVTANDWILRTDHLQTSPTGAVQLRDTQLVQMSNTSGAVNFYFHVPPIVDPAIFGGDITSGDVVIGFTYFEDPDNFLIYQGNTLIANAAVDAIDLTTSDKTKLKSTSVPANWFGGTTFAPLAKSGSWVSGSGKISFTHNPAGGQNYTIVSLREGRFDHWSWALEYPSDIGSSITAPPSSTSPIYNGLFDVEPTTMLLQVQPVYSSGANQPGTVGGGSQAVRQLDGTALQAGINTSVNNNNGFASIGQSVINTMSQFGFFPAQVDPVLSTWIPQCFGLTAYGMKPNTTHKFYINGIDKSHRCRPFGKNLGDPIITDNRGMVVFDLFYDGNTVDQDINRTFLSQSNIAKQTFGAAGAAALGTFYGVNWATHLASSVSQPVGVGSLKLELKAPSSSVSYTLTVAQDAEFVIGLMPPTTSVVNFVTQAVSMNGLQGQG